MPTKLPSLAFACAWLFAACSSSAQPARQMTPAEVVATVNGAPITLGEVDAKALQESVSQFGNARLVQALYLARRAALDELVGNRLIELEAKAQGVEVATFIEKEITGVAPAPTDVDAEIWYRANAAAVQGRTFAEIREPIKGLLQQQRLDNAQAALLARLKEKTPVAITLEPPRQTVVSAGHPAKGPANAPIEIVEFSDFQCPFCQRATPTVTQVLQKYGDQVRLVYRHFPLPNHPDAQPAAEASACAHEQGKFWPYHDRLFAEFGKLSVADLKAHAAAVGLDVTAFNACVDSGRFKTRVEQDVQEAQALGVTGTPAFFVNGRALEGAQPLEAFTRLIDEELAAKKK